MKTLNQQGFPHSVSFENGINLDETNSKKVNLKYFSISNNPNLIIYLFKEGRQKI